MSASDVEAFYDRIMNSPEAADAARVLVLSPLEWTAYCHGVKFEQLSVWRFTGSPTQCAACGTRLLVENYGWVVTEFGGQVSLRHIHCPD
jgi:hypothetical protein